MRLVRIFILLSTFLALYSCDKEITPNPPDFDNDCRIIRYVRYIWNGDILEELSFSYDESGRLTNINDLINPHETEFRYNDKGQVSEIWNRGDLFGYHLINLLLRI